MKLKEPNIKLYTTRKQWTARSQLYPFKVKKKPTLSDVSNESGNDIFFKAVATVTNMTPNYLWNINHQYDLEVGDNKWTVAWNYTFFQHKTRN